MNAVIYARYSSHNQTEQSIEGQISAENTYELDPDTAPVARQIFELYAQGLLPQARSNLSV